MPPTSIDGTDITGATIDGTDVTEITVDGQTVFTAGLPDSGDLHSRYDAEGLSSGTLSTWTDEVSSFDMSASGTPNVIENELNGKSVVNYGGSEFHQTTFTSFPQPYTIFLVARWDTLGGSIIDGGTTNEAAFFVGTNDFRFFSGSNTITGGSNDTNYHIFTILVDSPSTVVRVDGTQVISGDSGNDSRTGNTAGARADGTGSDSRIAEYGVYDSDKSAIFGDIESHLSDKWGIAI